MSPKAETNNGRSKPNNTNDNNGATNTSQNPCDNTTTTTNNNHTTTTTTGTTTTSRENNGSRKVKGQRSRGHQHPIPVPPPDGGWGWMIVLSSFVVSILVDGVCFSAGIFFNPFRDYFHATKAQTAWVGSVLNGSYLTVGPVVSACANRWGCRRVAVLGSLFAGIAFFCSTFSTSMPVLIITYGMLGGIGFGFVYLPAIVMPGYYFEKKRALATGIACCGSGIGAFIFAPLCNLLLEEYGWQGATWILSGLVFNGVVFSIFYRPLEHKTVVVEVEGEDEACADEKKTTTPAGDVVGEEEMKALLGGDSIPLNSHDLAAGEKGGGGGGGRGGGGQEEKVTVNFQNSTTPTTSANDTTNYKTSLPEVRLPGQDDKDGEDVKRESCEKSEEAQQRERKAKLKAKADYGLDLEDLEVMLGGGRTAGGKNKEEGEGEGEGKSREDLKTSFLMDELVKTVTPEIHRVQSNDSKGFLSDLQLQQFGGGGGSGGSIGGGKGSNPVARMAFSQDVMAGLGVSSGGAFAKKPQHLHHRHHHHHHSHNHHHNLLDNPLQRRDIFYSGSLRNIPEYKSSHSLAEYRQKVVIPLPGDSSEEEGDEEEGGGGGGRGRGREEDAESVLSGSSGSSRGRRTCFQRYVLGPLLTVFDVSLLRSPTFDIYGLSCILSMLGFFVPFIYLPTLCIDMGVSSTNASFLISIIGIANTVTRVGVGFISDRPWADCLLINNVALIVGGAATCCVPFLGEYWLFATYTFIFGSSIAIFVSLRSIIMVELMGLQKLTNAFGLVIMCQGISSFVGAPIAGMLSDMTGDYNISFYVAGTCLAMGGVICLPLRRISNWERERDRRRLEALLDAQLARLNRKRVKTC